MIAFLLALAPLPFEADFRQVCGSAWLKRACTAKCESNFNPKAVSFDHGEGLGQATGVWPWYVKMGWVPAGSTPFQVRPAIAGIHHHEKWLGTRFEGDWIAVSGAYNAGELSVRRAMEHARAAGLSREDWLQTLPLVTKKNAQYTIRYIAHKRAVLAQWQREGRR